MKNVFFLVYFVAFGIGMYWLGTRAERKNPPAYVTPDPEMQDRTLAVILTGIKALPTQVTAEDWQQAQEVWQRESQNLDSWCEANPAYPLQSFARVAWANCAAALDALQSGMPGNDSSEKICSHIMARASARNADLLAILMRPQ